MKIGIDVMRSNDERRTKEADQRPKRAKDKKKNFNNNNNNNNEDHSILNRIISFRLSNAVNNVSVCVHERTGERQCGHGTARPCDFSTAIDAQAESE